MTTAQTDIYQTVPRKDYFSLFRGDDLNYSQVIKTLEFKKEDVSKAIGVPLAAVRYDEKMSQDVRDRITEWATLLNLVAQHFEGNVKKACLWLTISNPLLGDISPRDMIRFGRYKRLLKFILNAVAENAH